MANESEAEPAAQGDRFKILIAGGGVAGVEALLALRSLLGAQAEVELIAPTADFIYRPLAIAEPFGLGEAYRVNLETVTRDLHASFRRDSVAGVDSGRRIAKTAAGEELAYDALLLAVGVRPLEELPGALTYAGPQSNEHYKELLAAIAGGDASRIAFATPVTARWSLPLYELALLTANQASSDGIDVELTVVTPESRPLEMFGPRASELVKQLLVEAGVEIRTSRAPSAVEPGELVLASGERVPADRVVALPRLEVESIGGIPQGPHGFIGTDAYMQVEGTARVYAAGDATWFPIKQGGIAAQQADVAATSISSIVDPQIAKTPLRPVLRGAILTGGSPRYLRAEIGDRPGTSAAGAAPLWWPPSKIAARYLAPYLARSEGDDEAQPLEDVSPLHGEDLDETVRDHQESLELALAAADADARWRDHRAALRWLGIAEQLNLTLPPGYEEKRRQWERALRESEPA
jgi:sulfide:quinone oxidoreductase